VHGARVRTRRHKKTRVPKEPGSPVSPNGFRPAAGPHREDSAGGLLQAGFLTLGSSYRLRLPTGRPTSNPLELRNAPWYPKRVRSAERALKRSSARQWPSCSLRPRSQRRARSRFPRDSLL